MTSHDPIDHADVWSQTVAATEYVAAIARPGFTVWDALREAIDDWCTALLDVRFDDRPGSSWDDPDPLRTAVERLLGMTAPAIAGHSDGLGEVLAAALSVWLARTADDVNDGHRFVVRFVKSD